MQQNVYLPSLAVRKTWCKLNAVTYCDDVVGPVACVTRLGKHRIFCKNLNPVMAKILGHLLKYS